MPFFLLGVVALRILSLTEQYLDGEQYRQVYSLAYLQQLNYMYQQDMYKRECEKMAKGLARSVPKLREIHVIRDSWTKLNVAPAKIMQVQLLGH